MADTAAHLVDRVLPRVPVRQWALSLRFALRFSVAFDRELCRQVRTVFMETVLCALRRRAQRQGIDHGRSGAVVFVQRFGGALNLNVHFHALVLDGVFHDEDDDEQAARPPTFRVARRMRTGELADVLLTIQAKIRGLLQRGQLTMRPRWKTWPHAPRNSRPRKPRRSRGGWRSDLAVVNASCASAAGPA